MTHWHRSKWLAAAAPLSALPWASLAWAQVGDQQSTQALEALNNGDTAWMLAASALVLLMVIPGIPFFYGGLVRSKNVIGTMVQTFAILCVVTLVWVVCGYSLAYSPDRGGVIGGLDWMFLTGVAGSPYPSLAPTVPHQAFMLFQLLFAAFTPALIAGAFAERMRFSSLLLFTLLWSLFVYVPIAHWVWGGGWLKKLGALDFAGGMVVHVSSGFSALACAMVLGKRRGWRTDYMAPHNLPYVLLGTGLLWTGWFGFNGGSARAASGVAVNAIVVTHLTAVMAAFTWMVVEWHHRGKPTVLGIATGAIAGLATSTAGAGFMGPAAAMLVGAAAGACSYFAIVWKGRIGYDDTLDVLGTHGIGGIIGTLATGVFASRAINPLGGDGVLAGNSSLFGTQLIAVIAVIAFSFIGTYAILKLMESAMGLRVAQEEESTGLDLSQHNERAYS